MDINFSQQQWQKIIDDANQWWEGTLNRPLIQVRLKKDQPDTDFHFFQSFYPLDVPADKVVADAENWINSFEYLGDAFPYFFPNFGAGVIAAFLGAKLTNGDNTVWFHPAKEKEVTEIDFQFDPENPWYKRVRDILQAAVKRWQGRVQVAMTDLGGNLDILSTFRPGEKLLLDLYDHPKKVAQLTWQSHDLWWKYFREFERITADVNPGYSTWARVFSPKSHYMLQCDFCYMISPEMFEKFVKPELKACCDNLEHAFFHLDGPGQLPHLDSLLEIDTLKGVQWIPGAGAPDLTQWPQVFRKIAKAGKKIQLMGHLSEKPFDETLDIITDQIGTADNIVYTIESRVSKRDRAEKLLARYN